MRVREPVATFDLETALVERLDAEDWDATLTADAAERAGAFADDHEDADLTAEIVLDLPATTPYDDHARRWNWVDDPTDSRECRLVGFGEVGATG